MFILLKQRPVIKLLLTTIFSKANFIQDAIQSELSPDQVLENWNVKVPTIYHEYFALEESP